MKKTIQTDYQLQQDQKYLTLSDQQLTGEEYVLKMLDRNDLAGYLKPSVKSFNGEPCIWYNISGLQTMESVYNHRSIDSGTLESLFRAIENAITLADEYLLSVSDLVMEPGYIYCHPQRNSFCFVYYPGSASAEERPYERLAEFILRRLSHSDRRALELGYQFYEEASNDNFSFTDLMEDIREGKTQLLQIPAQAEGAGSFTDDLNAPESGDGRGMPDGYDTFSGTSGGQRGMQQEKAGTQSRVDPLRLTGRLPGKETAPGRNGQMRKNISEPGRRPGKDSAPGMGQRADAKKAGSGRVLLYLALGLLLAGLYTVLVVMMKPDLQMAGGLVCAMIAGAVLCVKLISGKRVPHNNWEDEETQEDDLAFMEELMQDTYARSSDGETGGTRRSA